MLDSGVCLQFIKEIELSVKRNQFKPLKTKIEREQALSLPKQNPFYVETLLANILFIEKLDF